MTQRFFADRFRQAWSKDSVYLDCGPNDLLSLFRTHLSVPSVISVAKFDCVLLREIASTAGDLL